MVTEEAKLRGKGEVRLGSIDKILEENLEAATGQEARFVALGHLPHGGAPIAKAGSRLRTVAPDSETVASARSVGICFGD